MSNSDTQVFIFQVSSIGEILSGRHLETKVFLDGNLEIDSFSPNYNSIDPKLLFYSHDGHFNERGAQFFANFIVSKISDRL
jgi:hypothetical protein